MVAQTDSDMEKAKKIYEAVEALENTDLAQGAAGAAEEKAGRRGAQQAEDVWSKKRGSSEEIALLYLALARAAGLTAYDIKVVDRDTGVFSPGYLSFDQLDGDLVIVEVDGKEIFVDPGEKSVPV